MKEGPNIAAIGALVGDPARANILTALMHGQALTAMELALECGLTPPTVSSHLAKLQAGGLLRQHKQGRHRYFSLSGSDVGGVLESMMHLAASRGHMRVRVGPKDQGLREARVCYDHLAGDSGVSLLDALMRKGFIRERQDEMALTRAGRAFVAEFGIDVAGLERQRRPLCKACLDWSVRRNHLGGSLGAALMERIFALGWAKREAGTRLVRFSRKGEPAFLKLLSD
jgi:DNA-binding transcriptional ArsR family regulator